MELIKFIQNNQYKIFKTLLTYMTFVGHGCINTLVGSSLLDLQILVQRSFEITSRMVPARSIGYVIGASSCGLYEKRIDDYLVLSISTLICAICISLSPWFTQLEYVFILMIVAGFAQGVFDIYCNVIILRIWGENGINWLQVLHMSYGLGALIAPIFTRPFLLPNIESADFNSLININNVTHTNTTTSKSYSPDDVKVQYAFGIVGGMLMVVSIPYFFCYLHDRKAEKIGVKEVKLKQVKSEASSVAKAGAVIIAALVANFSFGTESVVGNLATAFGVNADVKMDKKDAVLLTTCYWTMYSFYRLIFIPLTIFIKEDRLFVVNLFIIIIAIIVMVPRAASQSTFTWISFILLGIGHSPIFSIAYGSLGKYFHVSNFMTSFIFINGVIGETIHVSIVSKFVESKPIFFIYYLGSISIIFVIISGTLPVYCKKVIKKPKAHFTSVPAEEMQEL
ncbi:sodium-dependent glucose transporter 1C-like [Panonychus citri]|uniref:sodium-dependent glucose transporter 1C-like n=1 Tax=Panonychus citri TaxID=50023 RepID=UPI0023075C0D|nr:sodium-dependent glucose transporter 1C-like [Panonychus citri]